MLATGTAGRRLLLVDDDFLTREAATLVLAGAGYMVAAAANGLEALERLRKEERPDLILLDLKMPGMDGRQFCCEQARNEQFAGIPILVMSANSDARQQADALGAAGCLQKPIEAADLLEAVRRCCCSSAGGKNARNTVPNMTP
jgi:CheY-like chemotaxis protein